MSSSVVAFADVPYNELNKEPRPPGIGGLGSAAEAIALVIATKARGDFKSSYLPEQIVRKIGGQSTISHLLHQLQVGGIQRAAVIAGSTNKEAAKEAAMEDPDGTYGDFQISFVDLGEDFSGTFAESVVKGQEALGYGLADDVLLLVADVIYDSGIISELKSRSMALTDGDICRMVEDDVSRSGMVMATILVGYASIGQSGRRK